MLGSFGLWSSSKGMVLVPNLSGLTSTQAIAAISAAGLNYSGSSSTTTSNASLNDYTASQLPNANDLVDYGSSVSFIYYNYVPSGTTTTTTPGSGTTTTTTTSGGGGTSAPRVANISTLTYTKTGTTTGTLSWTGTNIDFFMYTGDSSLYPAPYNYGTYTSSWPGNLVNLVEGQSYTVTIDVRSSDNLGNSKTITFTHALATTTTTTTTTAGLYTIWSGCYNGVTEDAGYGSGPQGTPGWDVVVGSTDNSSLTKEQIRALIGGGCVTTTTTTTTTAAPTYTRNEVRSVSSAQCPSTQATYSVTYANSNYTGEISAVFVSCIGSATTTTTTTAAPTTTTTTTAAPTYCRNEVKSVDPLICSSGSANYNVCYSSPGYTGQVSSTLVSCVAPTTTTTTTAAATTEAPTYCRGEVRSISTFQCPSGNANYTICYSDPAYQNQVSGTFLSCVGSETTTAAPGTTTTTTAAATTTTTAAPSGNKNCTSLDVAEGYCDSQGCDTGGCGSGSSCTTGQNRCSAI